MTAIFRKELRENSRWAALILAAVGLLCYFEVRHAEPLLLFSLADHLATLGPRPLQPPGDAWERHLSVVRLLLTCYIRERESVLPPRLLSPEELMRRLKLEPGPIVGQLLEAIAEAQAEGTIHSKEEALWFAEEHLEHS